MDIELQILNEELRALNPPIPRDREIFEEAVVQRQSHREIAQQHGISQPRVTKIVAEVGAWLCRVLPASLAGEEPRGKLALAAWLAKSRLEFLHGKAMQKFDESCRDKVTHKTRKGQEVPWEETITTTQTGKVGLINSALRATLASARLSGVDVTGQSVRKAALAAQSVGAQGAVIAKTGKRAEIQESESPQVAQQQSLKAEAQPVSRHSEAELKQVIKIDEHQPDQGQLALSPHTPAALSFAGASGWCRQTGQQNGVESNFGLCRGARRRLEREQRRTYQQHRRRDFLAHLAAG